MNKNYYIWVEIEANKERILNETYFDKIMDKCAASGIGSIILAVKDTSGFGIYNSKIVPHYSKFDKDFEEKDYLETYIKMAKSKGLKLYAGIDVFAEGRSKEKHELSPGYKNPEWQTHMYGVDHEMKPKIRPISDLGGIRTSGSIDDFNEIFVNPVMESVRNYEASIVKELIDNYDIDGVVLDRVRFVGLGSDFSPYTKGEFENFINSKVESWPEDIYKLRMNKEELDVEFGPLFGKWVTFRAAYIKKFIEQIRSIVDVSGKNVEFIDYTGSWYPIYYLVGANWAKKGYLPEEYPWVDESFGDTGYGELIDKLLSGFYYEDITIEEALKNNKPHYWYSVEGSGELVDRVVGDAVPYVGSLYLKQYAGNSERFRKAVEMCFEKSEGCMLFDLCYVDDYDWWNQCTMEKNYE